MVFKGRLLNRPPQSFNEDVIDSKTLTIHTDPDLFTLQILNPLVTCKLTALVRVNKLRPPMPLDSLFCDINER